MLVVVEFADLRIEDAHHLDHGAHLLAALLLVLDGLHLLDHLLYVAAVFGQHQLLSLRIVIHIRGFVSN